MFGSELRQWILGLLPTDAVMLVRTLLLAEANRLRCGLGLVRMTGNISAPDAGVDARTDLPVDTDSVFPSGACTWQVKAGSDPPNIEVELNKEGVAHDLAEGRRYVLVWTRDPSGNSTLEATLNAATTARGAEALLLTAEDVERLARVHPAVVHALGGPSLFGLSLARWGMTLDIESFRFVADDVRAAQLQQVREFAESSDRTMTHLHLFGDTGVGKSRVTHEALDTDGLRQRVLVAPGMDDVDRPRLSQLVSTEDAYMVLVVDDCTWEEPASLEKFASAAEGRIRLVTIGDRPTRETKAQRRA